MKDIEFKIKAVWLWAQTVFDAGASGAEEILTTLEKYGFTDVYLLVKGEAGRAAFSLGSVPLERSYANDGGRDILAEVIAAAHKRGIRVHAWCTFLKDSVYTTAHPDAAVTHFARYDGIDVKRSGGNWVSPLDTGYLDYSKRLFAELAANYDIDGVHFDNIRYGHMLYGWGERDIAKLIALGASSADISRLSSLMRAHFFDGGEGDGKSMLRAMVSGERAVSLFVRKRASDVEDFARAVIGAVRAAQRKPLIISASFMPEGANAAVNTENAADNGCFGLLHYGQNYDDAPEIFDYICPMAYHNAFSKPPRWSADIARAAIGHGCRVVCGIQAYADEGGSTASEISECVSALADIDDENMLGISLFRFGTFDFASVTL